MSSEEMDWINLRLKQMGTGLSIHPQGPNFTTGIKLDASSSYIMGKDAKLNITNVSKGIDVENGSKMEQHGEVNIKVTK